MPEGGTAIYFLKLVLFSHEIQPTSDSPFLPIRDAYFSRTANHLHHLPPFNLAHTPAESSNPSPIHIQAASRPSETDHSCAESSLSVEAYTTGTKQTVTG